MADGFKASGITHVGHKARKEWKRPQDEYDILNGAARQKREAKVDDGDDDADLITGVRRGEHVAAVPAAAVKKSQMAVAGSDEDLSTRAAPAAGRQSNQLPRPERQADRMRELNDNGDLDLVTGLPKSRPDSRRKAHRGSTERAFHDELPEDVDLITGQRKAVHAHKYPPSHPLHKE